MFGLFMDSPLLFLGSLHKTESPYRLRQPFPQEPP